MGHFEMVTTLLAAMTLMDVFQVTLGMRSLGWEPVTLPEESALREATRQISL